MRKLLTGIGALLIAACGPELGDNEALRCEETFECGPASYCYRGFCVPDNSAPQTVEVDPATGEVDAGQGLLANDAGNPPVEDASEASDPHDTAPIDAAASASDASSATVQTPSTPAPAPATPAATPATPAATPATPAIPAAPATPINDAGVPTGSSCTLKECCAEAKKAYQERKEHEDEDRVQKPGKCGCSAPDLLNTLSCELGSLTGLP